MNGENQCVARSERRASTDSRCGAVGVYPSVGGLVCANHHRFGYIPYDVSFASTPSDAMALRMRAVLED